MKRYLCFVISFLTVSCAVSHSLPENGTKYTQINANSDPNFTPNHITVVSEMEANKTIIATLGQARELELAQGRTFGIKRLQFMLLPVMYKLGVMSTLLVALVVISLKSLLIGVILLVVKVGGFIASFKHSYHESPSAHSWPQPYQQQQPVHIHLHNSGDKHPPHDYHQSFYDRYDQQGPYQVSSGWDGSQVTNPYGKLLGMDSHGQYIFKG